MGHCIGGPLGDDGQAPGGGEYWQRLRDGRGLYVSYRDPDGVPQVTIELMPRRIEGVLSLLPRQVQGPYDGPVTDPDARIRVFWLLYLVGVSNHANGAPEGLVAVFRANAANLAPPWVVAGFDMLALGRFEEEVRERLSPSLRKLGAMRRRTGDPAVHAEYLRLAHQALGDAASAWDRRTDPDVAVRFERQVHADDDGLYPYHWYSAGVTVGFPVHLGGPVFVRGLLGVGLDPDRGGIRWAWRSSTWQKELALPSAGRAGEGKAAPYTSPVGYPGSDPSLVRVLEKASVVISTNFAPEWVRRHVPAPRWLPDADGVDRSDLPAVAAVAFGPAPTGRT